MFQPEKPDDVERLKALQRDVHDVFIGVVKERRAGKLAGPDPELFSGAFWSAPKAQEFGSSTASQISARRCASCSATRCD